jgi:hypothetical protein
MRNVLGRACPHDGCEESIIEARRERMPLSEQTIPIAVCPRDHLSVIEYDSSYTYGPPTLHVIPRLPEPGPPEPPRLPRRLWGKAPLHDRILRRLGLR